MEKTKYQFVEIGKRDKKKSYEKIEFTVADDVLEVDNSRIKEILKHYNAVVQQIHRRIVDIQKMVNESNNQLIEIATYAQGSKKAEKSGPHKELTDVYLKYQQLVEEKERDLSDEMRVLIMLADGVNRLYLCFQSLSGAAYEILDKLYMKRIPYKAVEQESGFSHRIFEDIRKNAIEEIQKLYESGLTNAQIVRYSKLERSNEKIPEKKAEQYEQLSLFHLKD